MRASGLLPGFSRSDLLGSLVQQVLQLQSFNEVSIPHHAAIGDADILVLLHDIVNDAHARLEVRRIAVDGSVLLHVDLQLTADFAVGKGPVAWRILSILAMESSPALAGNLTAGLLGFTRSAVVSAACLPKTTKSSKELAPKRLAPCTEALPASPAASRPGTITLVASFTTCVFQFVGMPPML